MKLKFYIRSVLGTSIPAAKRLDTVDVYLQLDVHDARTYFLWEQSMI